MNRHAGRMRAGTVALERYAVPVHGRDGVSPFDSNEKRGGIARAAGTLARLDRLPWQSFHICRMSTATCAIRYPVPMLECISGFRGAGGNTRQAPSSCRKKNIERAPSEADDRASTHLVWLEFAKVHRVTCTGAIAVGASHLSMSARKELSPSFMPCSFNRPVRASDDHTHERKM